MSLPGPASASASGSVPSAVSAPSLSLPNSPADLRASLLTLARTAEKSERWADVTRFMKELIKLLPSIQHAVNSEINTASVTAAPAPGPGPIATATTSVDLSEEERHLLTIGTKQLIGSQRAAWKSLRAVPPLPLAGTGFAELLEDYRQQLEKELHLQCSELIQLYESILIKLVHRQESKIVYLKQCGDYYRYLCELVLARTGYGQPCPGGYDKKSHEYYTTAYKLALLALPPNHPTRLATCLNLSVCLYEVVRDRKGACDIAKTAFDAAIAKLEELEEHKYKDATLIMQLLRDNLTLWTQQQQQHHHHQQPQTH